MISPETVAYVEGLVKPQYQKLSDWCHGWLHIQNVRKTAVELAQAEGYDSLPCEIAALCHDLGRVIEEEEGKLTTDHRINDHATLSIEPTARVLTEVGITGREFGRIMEAVAVHSFRTYSGRNTPSRVLMDADKRDSLGPQGILRTSRYHFRKDLIPASEILAGFLDPDKVVLLANRTLAEIKKDTRLRERYIKVLGFALEWADNRMFGTESAYSLFADAVAYTREARDFLLPYTV